MDVEDVAPGQNFAETLDRTLANCDAVLIVMGPRWREILRHRAATGQEDYVSFEIQAALQRSVTVIPVLVGGAGIDQLADLPESFASLRFRQAAELRDATFKEDCQRLARSLGAAGERGARAGVRRKVLLGVGAVAALMLATVLFRFAGREDPQVQRLLATARVQTEQGEYEPAFHTYGEALRLDPEHQRALDLQVDAAMLWLQNFRVLAAEGQKVEDLAGPRLAEIMTVLHGGLARTNGKVSRAADILAHLGWAHWLNQRMAYKEFGPAAERDLRQALAVEPANVYAHAMLGNWLLQRRGDVKEALGHFDAALRSGKQRPLIRTMQLGGMLHNDAPGVRPALIRALDQMRREREPLDDSYRRRVVSAYNPTVNSADELKETLTAVPPDDAWATLLWLDPPAADGSDADGQRIRHAFIHASLDEIRGKKPEALAAFQNLERELKAKGYSGRITSHVSGAIRRLSP